MTENNILDSILDEIKTRSEDYKKQRRHEVSHALKLLHQDIIQMFKCTWELSEDKRA